MRRINFLAPNKAISRTIVAELPTLEQGLTVGGGTGLPSHG
jgi:hypothetical protein